jgi:hypothetical protein
MSTWWRDVRIYRIRSRRAGCCVESRNRWLFLKLMSNPRRRTIYVIAALAILAAALTVAYRSFRHTSAHIARPLRAAQHDAASAVDGQMLQGKFGDGVSPEQRQIVMAELHAPDQSYPTPASAPGIDTRTGKQQIVLTQPLGTTVQDTQPTLTWDVRIDGWSYWVHVEDRDSHQTVATSPVLDEAIWTVPTPLLRGHSYLWRVDASPSSTRTAATAATSSTAQFSVLSDEGEKEIENAKAGNASHLLLGSLYGHYGMWREAVLEYRKLVDGAPDSPDALKLLRNAEVRSNAQLATGAPR